MRKTQRPREREHSLKACCSVSHRSDLFTTVTHVNWLSYERPGAQWSRARQLESVKQHCNKGPTSNKWPQWLQHAQYLLTAQALAASLCVDRRWEVKTGACVWLRPSLPADTWLHIAAIWKHHQESRMVTRHRQGNVGFTHLHPITVWGLSQESVVADLGWVSGWVWVKLIWSWRALPKKCKCHFSGVS